jgi:hypothetical protein
MIFDLPKTFPEKKEENSKIKRKMFVRLFCYATKLLTSKEIVEILTSIELLKAVDFCVIYSLNSRGDLNKSHCRYNHQV